MIVNDHCPTPPAYPPVFVVISADRPSRQTHPKNARLNCPAARSRLESQTMLKRPILDPNHHPRSATTLNLQQFARNCQHPRGHPQADRGKLPPIPSRISPPIGMMAMVLASPDPMQEQNQQIHHRQNRQTIKQNRSLVLGAG